jgi:predicted O-methyltransferase YrrM
LSTTWLRRRPHSGDGGEEIRASRHRIDIDPQRIKEANENVQKSGVADKVKIMTPICYDRHQRSHRGDAVSVCRR